MKRWVNYWGAKGYVGPPLKLLGRGCPPPPPPAPPAPPPPPLFLRLCFNCILVISGRRKVDIERLRAMEFRLRLRKYRLERDRSRSARSISRPAFNPLSFRGSFSSGKMKNKTSFKPVVENRIELYFESNLQATRRCHMRSLECMQYILKVTVSTQRAHNVKKRLTDVMMSHRQQNDVISTLCACWEACLDTAWY